MAAFQLEHLRFKYFMNKYGIREGDELITVSHTVEIDGDRTSVYEKYAPAAQPDLVVLYREFHDLLGWSGYTFISASSDEPVLISEVKM